MLTQRGWAVAGAGAALLFLWYLFGEIELGLAGLSLVVAAVAGWGWVHRGEPIVEVNRRATPSAVHEGNHASVTLQLANRGVPLRQLGITEEVRGLGTADFATASLPRGVTYRATYRVLCRPRGIYAIGPTRLRISDPLGMASIEREAGRVDKLVVYPAVEDLVGFPEILGRNLAVRAHRPEQAQQGGEEFYTLRDYEHGDDLRRIHWPSSARQDRLMIRQLDTPWQARSLVVLDVRPGGSSSAFETTVSGAASVIRHLSASGFETSLWAGGGSPIRVGKRSNDYARAMEALAEVAHHPRIDFASLATRLRNQGGGGMLVVATSNPDSTLLGLARVLAAEYPTAVMLICGEPDTGMGQLHRAGVVTVTTSPGEPWAPAWNQAMRKTWHAASVGS